MLMMSERGVDAAVEDYTRRLTLERRRLKVVRMSAEILGEMLKQTDPGKAFSVESEIPADAAMVRVGYDVHTDCFVGVYYHPSFPVTHECDHIPQVNPAFTAHHDLPPKEPPRARD